jgi:putative ABC transport system permease protein
VIQRLAARFSKVPIALLSVAHERLRLLAALSGICFAVVFMFLQLTFLDSLDRTAIGIIQRLDADLVLISDRFLHLGSAGEIERSRVSQAKASSHVARATPISIRLVPWRSESGPRIKVFGIGFGATLGINPLLIPELDAQIHELTIPDTILVDRISQPSLGDRRRGAKPRLGQIRCEVRGQYTMGVGFFAAGSIVLNEETFAKIFNRPLSTVELGLIKLSPGSDPNTAIAELRELLPPDTKVLTRDQLVSLQRRFWIQDTALGNVFFVGILLGLSVGLVVLYQILASDILRKLPQYATLKSVGYSDFAVYSIIVRKALVISSLSYVPALIFIIALSDLVRGVTLLPVFMTFERALGVLCLTLFMATGSALIAARRISLADPAELFN